MNKNTQKCIITLLWHSQITKFHVKRFSKEQNGPLRLWTKRTVVFAKGLIFKNAIVMLEGVSLTSKRFIGAYQPLHNFSCFLNFLPNSYNKPTITIGNTVSVTVLIL